MVLRHFYLFSTSLFFFHEHVLLFKKKKISCFKGTERFESRAGARFLRTVLLNKKETKTRLKVPSHAQ